MTQVLFERLTDEPNDSKQKAVLDTGINHLTDHMGNSLRSTLDTIYSNHLSYAKYTNKKPPTPEEVLKSLLELIEAGLYKMYVK